MHLQPKRKHLYGGNMKENCKAQQYMDETTLATRWNVSTKLIQKFRLVGGGPAFVKIGRSVRYDLGVIEAYEQANTHSNTCK